jgi:7-cyano-7-deazaguanine synthase
MKSMVLLSGGLDSAVCLYWARSQGWELFPIEFEYFDRPERERQACRNLCADAGIRESLIVPVPFLREISDLSDSVLANPALSGAPEGYIPARNLIFYALSAYHAEVVGAARIVGGHNRTDGESFPDAGKAFRDRLNEILRISMWSHSALQTEVVLPLIEMDKIEVIRLGVRLGVPFQLTWSCYFNATRPCGVCISCVERMEALAAAGPGA